MAQIDVRESVWLITGASVGFGRAIASEVLERGGRVVATARSRASIADLKSRDLDRALALPLDVTQQAQVDAAVRDAEARFEDGVADIVAAGSDDGSDVHEL